MQLTFGPGNFSSNASDIVTFGTLLYAAQVVHLECNCYHASSKCDPSNSPVSTTSSTPLVAAGVPPIHSKQSQLTSNLFLFRDYFFSTAKAKAIIFALMLGARTFPINSSVASVFSSPWPSPTLICMYDYILTRLFFWMLFQVWKATMVYY